MMLYQKDLVRFYLISYLYIYIEREGGERFRLLKISSDIFCLMAKIRGIGLYVNSDKTQFTFETKWCHLHIKLQSSDISRPVHIAR